MTGGPGAAFLKAFRIIQLEGFAGILRSMARLRHFGSSSTSDQNLYHDWIRRYDTPSTMETERLLNRISELEQPPLISVLMQTCNSNVDWFIEAIESVTSQIYPHWELCFADDNSTSPEIRQLLSRYAANDPRVRIAFRNESGATSKATNDALAIARGDWITVLDNNDRFSAQALFWIATTAADNPKIDFIYTDEDKLDTRGRRCEPHFKCDWNPDLFYSQNMAGHLCAYRHSLIKSVSGFRKGFEGAHDYDLNLRCIESITSQQIYHIPKVLYHWRAHSDSSTPATGAKSGTRDSAQRALQEYHTRTGSGAQVECTEFGFRTQFPLPSSPPLVSLIIPTRNGLHLLQQCINSIVEKTTYPNYEIIIVDNDSDDPKVLDYLATISAAPNISVMRDNRPFNYSALNNQAAAAARGELIGLLNNDIEVISADWLEEMVSQALRTEIGAVGGKLLYPDNTIQHGGIILGIGGCAGHAHKGFSKHSPGYFGRANLTSNFSAVTAACLVVRKTIFEEVGGLNEDDLAIAFNDVDFCLRVATAGYRNLWTPYAELYHHESATRGRDERPEQKARLASEESYMKTIWGDWITSDPAYSPNLTLEHENFSFAFPPRKHSLGCGHIRS